MLLPLSRELGTATNSKGTEKGTTCRLYFSFQLPHYGASIRPTLFIVAILVPLAYECFITVCSGFVLFFLFCFFCFLPLYKLPRDLRNSFQKQLFCISNFKVDFQTFGRIISHDTRPASSVQLDVPSNSVYVLTKLIQRTPWPVLINRVNEQHSDRLSICPSPHTDGTRHFLVSAVMNHYKTIE